MVGQDGLDVAAVAAGLGVGWGTVMRAVREHGSRLIDDPRRLTGVVAVGVDETAFLAARRGQHTQFVTGIVAMAATADFDTALRSLEALRSTAAGTVLPGHGFPWLAGVDSAVAQAAEVGRH